MLSLDIHQNKYFAYDFEKKYIQSLIDTRDDVIKNGIRIDNKELHVSKANRKFLQKKLNNKAIKFLILSTPNEQKKILNLFKKKFPSLGNQKTKIYQFFKYIFITNGYDKLDTQEKKLFYRNLKMNTCVYCNRNYIMDVEKNGHIKGDIDHFYPKAKYPYFAMSFYNFIPVCKSCNRVKNEYDTTNTAKTIIHPYERTDEKVFTLTMSGVGNFSYEINDDLLKDLYIDIIYNDGHQDIAEELYIKFYQRDTKEHYDLLRKSFSSAGFDEDEVYRFITSGYSKNEDHHKRSLSKLIKDVFEELNKPMKYES